MAKFKSPEIHGMIALIETEEIKKVTKKVITLKTAQSGVVFVEFQGRRQHLLDNFKKGDNVIIDVWHNGKVSALGRKYNNIIANKIKHAN